MSNHSSIQESMRKSTRGRPRLSKLSLVVVQPSTNEKVTDFEFIRLTEYQSLIDNIKLENPLTASLNEKSNYIFKLKQGQQEAMRLTEAAKIKESVIAEMHEEQRRLKSDKIRNKKKEFCLMAREVLNNSIDFELKTTAKNKKDGKKSRVWEAIYLRFVKGWKLEKIAAKVRFSIPTICIKLKLFLADPEKFAQVYQQESDTNPVFIPDAKRSLIDDCTKSEHFYPTRPVLIHRLRQLVSADQQIPLSRLMKAARDELAIRKLKVKLKKVNEKKPNHSEEVQFVRVCLVQLFYKEKDMLIFDGTIFQQSAHAIYTYAPKGSKPQRRGKSYFLHRHLLVLLSLLQVEAVTCVKGTCTKDTIQDFFIETLSCLKEVHHGHLPWRYIFIDNAPVHDEDKLFEVGRRFNVRFVFNLVNNPEENPIEHYFGTLKAKFRQAVSNGRPWNTSTILASIKATNSKVVRRTVVACLSKTLTNSNFPVAF
jgi:hypothetical protein